MMRRVGDRIRAWWVSLLRDELDGVRAEFTTSWTNSFDELRRDIVAERDVADARVADHDLELSNAFHRVADAFESIAESLEGDRRDRRAQLDAVEFLLGELVIGFARPTAVPSVVIGGSVDLGALGTSPHCEMDIDLSNSLIPLDAHVEVRSRFDDHWVHGFAIAEYVSDAGRRGYRLLRLCDTEQLPLLFDAADVRPARPRSRAITRGSIPPRTHGIPCGAERSPESCARRHVSQSSPRVRAGVVVAFGWVRGHDRTEVPV